MVHFVLALKLALAVSAETALIGVHLLYVVCRCPLADAAAGSVQASIETVTLGVLVSPLLLVSGCLFLVCFVVGPVSLELSFGVLLRAWALMRSRLAS
ncbi:MAG: hypothetical protein M3Q54_11165 [Actinomycetota bacterium]|nr:hypothetical protein [Actinomycetota bacterium]